MSDDELALCRSRNKGRRLWDQHGSWVLLAIVGVSCYMVGSQMAAINANETLRTVIESHERKDAERAQRIRALTDANTRLTLQLGRTAGEVAEKAGDAATRAAEAAERAADATSGNAP